MRNDINGILLLDKPPNMTSNQALQMVKRLFNAKKAGHTGSLDPIATGMLPICFGEATKFSQFLLESDKVYDVVAKLGEETPTGDCESKVIKIHSVDGITSTQIINVIKNFLGKIKQTPPMFSAIKYQGKPLYELARQGIEIARKPREIMIYSLELMNFNDVTHQVALRVKCSKGTYIRTLIEDIGRVLGCGAHVIQLHRASVMSYHASNMQSMTSLEVTAKTQGLRGLLKYLLPLETAVEFFPAVKLSTTLVFYLRTGQPVRTQFSLNSPLVRLLTEDAKFLGIGEVMVDGRIKPKRLVA